MEKATFVRKACNLKDLRQCIKQYKMKEDLFIIEKVIELDKHEYDSLIKDFFKDRHWITDNIENMWREEEVWHCIIAKCKGEKVGLLIESEGYDYARYTAEIEVADE